MTNLSEHHQYLFLGKVTGTLNGEEEAKLNAMFRDDEEVELAYTQFVAKLPPDYVTESFKHLNYPSYWKDLGKKYEKKPFTIIWKRFSVAAMLAGLILGGWYLTQPKQKDTVAANVDTIKPQVVQLKLANGKIVDLTNSKGKIIEGTTELINVNNTLTYSSKSQGESGINQVIVPVGMDYQITLADGSEIWLNSTTELEFPTNFSLSKREISVKGEAYLNIKKDAKRPFLVRLPRSMVEVSGTEFNVNTYDSGASKVALVLGSVNFSNGQRMLNLTPGSEGIDNSSGSLIKRPFDAKIVLSWKKGLFFFEEANLNEISKVIERWFGVKTIIENKDLLNVKIAGVLSKKQSLEYFLDDLKAIAKINSYYDNEGVLHFK